MSEGTNPEVKAYNQGLHEGAITERLKITDWLRSLDKNGAGEINRFLPTTLANWIEERMHEL